MKNRMAPGARGFSLIELMVSMALGLIVIGAIGALFLSTKRTYAATESLSRTQESARFAVQFISRELQLAGYVAGFETGMVGADLLYPGDATFAVSGQVLLGIDNSTAAGVLPGSDVLQVRYGGNPTAAVRDCHGIAQTGGLITERLFVDSDNELVCSVDAGTPEPLIDGIANMQLTYGRDTDSDGSADVYSVASAVTDWTGVVSVRVALTVAADDAQAGADRAVTSVIALRNQLP